MIRLNVMGRGLVVAAVGFFVAPAVQALTITQSAVFNMVGEGPGSRISDYENWFVDLFSGPGTLESVSLALEFSGQVTSVERNVYGLTQPFTLTVVMDASLYFAQFASPVLYHYIYGDSATSAPVIIPPDAFHTFTAPLAFSSLTPYTKPADLAQFYGTGTTRLQLATFFDGYNRFGGTSGNATVTSTLTYTYNVPETGVTAIWLAGGLGMLLGAARRMGVRAVRA